MGTMKEFHLPVPPVMLLTWVKLDPTIQGCHFPVTLARVPHNSMDSRETLSTLDIIWGVVHFRHFPVTSSNEGGIFMEKPFLEMHSSQWKNILACTTTKQSKAYCSPSVHFTPTKEKDLSSTKKHNPMDISGNLLTRPRKLPKKCSAMVPASAAAKADRASTTAPWPLQGDSTCDNCGRSSLRG